MSRWRSKRELGSPEKVQALVRVKREVHGQRPNREPGPKVRSDVADQPLIARHDVVERAGILEEVAACATGRLRYEACPHARRSEQRPVSYTHLRAHETPEHLVCRLLLEKKK